MKKIRLAIIDDEVGVVTALAGIFKPNKRYKVRGYTSVRALWRDLEENPPQILICDYLMPECDGISLLRELKQRLPRLRSVLLTGQPLDDAITDRLQDGVVDLYIAKPWNQAELDEAVRRLAREVAKEE